MAEYEDEFYPLDIWSGKDKLNTNSGTLYLNMMAVNWAGDGPVKEEDFRKFTVESFFLVTSLVAVRVTRSPFLDCPFPSFHYFIRVKLFTHNGQLFVSSKIVK